MRTEISPDGTAVKIYGDHSPHPIIADASVVAQLGGAEAAFHHLKRMHNNVLLPRMGSESHPISMRDLELLEQNIADRQRTWRWISIQRGRDIYWGYARQDGDVEVFVDEMRVHPDGRVTRG